MARKSDTTLERAIDKLKNELVTLSEQRSESNIQRSDSGEVIILPRAMSITKAIQVLRAYLEWAESEASKNVSMRGHRDDMLAGFERALREVFGTALAAPEMVHSFFGSFMVPGRTVSVAIGYNEEMTVPYGNISVPGLEIKMKIAVRENLEDPMNSEAQVEFQYLQRWQPLVDTIEKEWRRQVRENSIFKGKAISSRFEFQNPYQESTKKLCYSVQEERDLSAMLFNFITATERVKKDGLSLNRCVLLSGKYGTGKTLTSARVAEMCVDNGWTFMNVLPGDSISVALNFAKRYQPCVVFFEDIASATQGEERTPLVNEVLNTIDGLLSKDAEILTILTTNHSDRISKAMIRPGRIDAIIELGNIDERAMRALVEVYASEFKIEGELDIQALLEASEGYTPAFVVEAVRRCMLYARSEERDYITSEDIETSLNGMRLQFNLMMAEEAKPPDTMSVAFSKAIKPTVDHLNEKILDIAEQVAEIYDHVT